MSRSLSKLRAVKVRKPTTDSVLFAARTTTNVTSQIADICQFPPVKAAAVILLAILETVENVKRNKEDCLRLAERAASILLDVRDHMKGRWHSAPPSLLKNLSKLESTLLVIYEFMKRESSANWRNRLMKRVQIEDALDDYNVLLDDAARTFQISALIDIHYSLHKAVASGSTLSRTSDVPEGTHIEILNSSEVNRVIDLYSQETVVTSPISDDEHTLDEDEVTEYGGRELVEDPCFENLEELKSFDDKGFARYSLEHIHRHGRVGTLDDGWWSGTTEAVVNGEEVIMKTYEGPQGVKNWLNDVKALQNLYHPNLPQLVGLSDTTTPIPFLLLTNVKKRTPEALVLDALHHKSLAFCAELILRLYRDVSEAALYTQKEYGLSDTQLQDFIEAASFRLDSEHSVIVGLPPPRSGNWVTWRSYGLTESLLGIALKMLPNRGHPMRMHRLEDKEMTLVLQRKLSHLAVFARGLLPDEKVSPALAPQIEALISDDTYDGSRPTLPLTNIRTTVLSGGATGSAVAHSWHENQAIPAYKFSVGDLGYVESGKDIGEGFVKLCNVIDDGMVKFDLAIESYASKFDFKDMRSGHQEVQGFPMGPSVMGWPIAVNDAQEIHCQVRHWARVEPTRQAWSFLLENGKALGERFGVAPDELVLITNAGTNQDCSIRNGFPNHFAHQHAFGHNHHQRGFGHPTHGRGGFGHPAHGHGGFGQQPFGGSPFGHSAMPKIFYLFTSPEKSFEPYWAPQPMLLPPGADKPYLGNGVTYSISWNHGYIYYIMGYSEDFQ